MNNREIKRRIASVKETVKITRAMYSISVAKSMKGRAALPSATLFCEKSAEMLSLIADKSPYFEKRGEKSAFIVIGGDKGLCGDYNQRVFEVAAEALKKRAEHSLFTVGTVTRDMLRKAGYEADVEFLHSAENPTPEAAYSMAADLMNLYNEGLLDEVLLVYSAVKGSTYDVKCVRMLPFDREEKATFTVGEGAIARAVYTYLAASIYHALVSSSLAEHLARVVAMPQATENGEKMIAELTAKYNQVRQESITRALQDVGSSGEKYE